MLKEKETEKTGFQMLPLLCNLGKPLQFLKTCRIRKMKLLMLLLWIIMGIK